MDLSSKRTSDLIDVLSTFGVGFREGEEVVELLQVILMEEFGDTHLPELYEVLGKEKFLKVLDIFQDAEMIPCQECGCAVKWPARSALEGILLDLIIYFRVRKAPLGSKSGIMREIASDSNMTPTQVRSSYLRTSGKADLLKHLNQNS